MMIEIGLWLDSIPESFDTHLLPGLQHGRASLHAAWLSLCVCVCAWVRCKVAILFNTLNSIRILALCALYLPLSSCLSYSLSLSPCSLSFALPLLAYLAYHLPFAFCMASKSDKKNAIFTWHMGQKWSQISSLKGGQGTGCCGGCCTS